MHKFVTILLAVLCIHMQAYAFKWDGDVAVTTGYRNDQLETFITAFDPPNTLILQDKLKASNVGVYLLGLKGKVSVFDGLFVKGYAQYGWVGCGRYREESAFPILVQQSATASKIKEGRTRDYSAGIGYLYPINNCFKVGASAGYAYDYQKIKLGAVTVDPVDAVTSETLSGLSYDMRWHGPWVGAETEFWYSCIKFNLGYEYHWAKWRANWTLSGPDVIGIAFSDNRRSNHAHGNVAFLDGKYAITKNFTAGLGLKYQRWQARKGVETPAAGSLVAVGLNDTEVDLVPQATWRAVEVQVMLGYNF